MLSIFFKRNIRDSRLSWWILVATTREAVFASLFYQIYAFGKKASCYVSVKCKN